MDQMVEQIERLRVEADKHARPLPQQEWEELASYINGDLDFRQIARLLPQTAQHLYAGYGYASDIASACKQRPETLLPRFGRFIRAVEYISPVTCRSMLNLSSNYLTVQQMFYDSGYGPQAMLRWKFCGDYMYYGMTAELLGEMERRFPGEIQIFVAQQNAFDRLPALGWLCSRKLEDMEFPHKKGWMEKLFGENRERTLGLQLSETILYGCLLAVRGAGGNAEQVFTQILEVELPEAIPLLQSGAMEEILKKAGSQRQSSADTYVVEALALADGRLPRLNAVARALCAAGYNQFFATLHVRYQFHQQRLDAAAGPDAQEEHTKTLLHQAETVSDMAKKMGIDPVYPMLWAVHHTYSSWKASKPGFRRLYGGNVELMRWGIPLAEPIDRVVLCRLLWEEGEPLPSDAEEVCLEILHQTVRQVSESDDVDEVARWLSTGEKDAAGPPPLAEFFGSGRYSRNHSMMPDQAMYILAGLSPLASRWVRYLADAGQVGRMLHGLDFLVNYQGYSALGLREFLSECLEPEQAILHFASDEDNLSRYSPVLADTYRLLVKEHPETAAELTEGDHADAATRLNLLETLYRVQPDYDPTLLIGKLSDKSKKIRQFAVSLLMPKPEWKEQIRPLLEAKRKDVREAAEQLMTAYEGELADSGDMDVAALCARSLPRNAKNSIAWAFPGDPPPVRWRESGEPADENVTLCYFALMLGAKAMEVPPAAKKIRSALREDDLRAAAGEVFSQWLSEGANTKQKGALLLYGVHAGDSEVMTLQRQIDQWAQNSRGAIASEAVRAMALGGSDLALMTVDDIGRKFKNKQVRRAGQEAFAAAAEALGTTAEVLGDRIIPTLGFNRRGERVIDYGSRAFTATLSPALTIELTDSSGKKIKSLPKPGAKDDEEAAGRAKADFTALKKSLKTVVSAQAQRLELALATGRRWDREAWEKLFVENPIMHCFAIGLVWGIYGEDGSLAQSFRYLEDGGFTEVNEEDFAPGDSSAIGLVHPLDLSEDLLSRWKQQLEDYEVDQPIRQLDRPVYRLEPAEQEADALTRFGGRKMLGITLASKLQKFGWYRGSVQDAGVFYAFYREIGSVGVQLNFSGMYVSPEPDEVIVVGEAAFYQAESVQRGSYVYDDVSRETVIPLRDVPPRMFSEMTLELENATASSAETKSGWESDATLRFFGGK